MDAILVTGFEPFGGDAINASWDAARRLAGESIAGREVHVLRTPCAYDESADAFMATAARLRPKLALLTGQAAARGAICVERFARNRDASAAPDNRGVIRRDAGIVAGAPLRLATPAPVAAMVAAIRALGLPARPSRDAGGYVCNHLYYRALLAAGRSPSAMTVVFVHLPATPGPGRARPLESSAAADALRAAAQAALAAAIIG